MLSSSMISPGAKPVTRTVTAYPGVAGFEVRTPRDPRHRGGTVSIWHEDAERLCDAIRDVKERVTYCSVCNNITDTDPCVFCTSASRDQRLICVVEEPQNVSVVDRTGGFRGVYHVLMGALSPLHGVGPDDLKIKGLLARIAGQAACSNRVWARTAASRNRR